MAVSRVELGAGPLHEVLVGRVVEARLYQQAICQSRSRNHEQRPNACELTMPRIGLSNGMERLPEWIAEMEAQGIVIVPISALYGRSM